jgi:hypothetical protein
MEFSIEGMVNWYLIILEVPEYHAVMDTILESSIEKLCDDRGRARGGR